MNANSTDYSIEQNVEETNQQLPAKSGFWPKLSSILFREVDVKLTPGQQKVEDALNKHFGLTEKEKSIIERMKAFWLQEITIGKKKKNND